MTSAYSNMPLHNQYISKPKILFIDWLIEMSESLGINRNQFSYFSPYKYQVFNPEIQDAAREKIPVRKQKNFSTGFVRLIKIDFNLI